MAGVLLLYLATAASAASLEDARRKLEAAKKDLLISELTEQKIAAELAAFKASGEATAETIKDYQVYLATVQEMVREHRRIVERMTALYERYGSARQPLSTEDAAGGRPVDAATEEEELSELERLDRQFNASVAAFDEMLLKEQEALSRRMERIRERSDVKMTGLAEEAAEAAERLRKQGVGAGESSASSSAETGEEASGDREGNSRKSGDMEPTDGDQPSEAAGADSAESSKGDSSAGGEGKSTRAEADDDDIVARQIREAAEKETDPDLKAKLWKEYEDYKRGQRQ